MIVSKYIQWVENEILPHLHGYDLNYRFFEEKGDFGSLYEIEFDSKKMVGSIDFGN